jgi:hypothetical protein
MSDSQFQMQTGDHGAISATASLFLPFAAFDVALLFNLFNLVAVSSQNLWG